MVGRAMGGLRRQGGKVCLVAVAFLMGGLFVPRVVEATTSSGDRAIFEPLAPARILDTRFGPSPTPVGTPVGAGATIEVQVLGQGGVLNDATAVALNVTVTGATQQSHLTVFPGATEAPNASNLNFGAGDTIPNSVVVQVGANGKVAIRNNAGTVHVITDVNGFYRGHNHDDRYDTKAQVDSKINNAQAEGNYVNSGQITDGQVGNADLAANAVTSAKIANGSIGSGKLDADSVTGANVQNGSLTTVDLQKSSRTFVLDATFSLVVPSQGCENIVLVNGSGLAVGDVVATTITVGTLTSTNLFIPVVTATPVAAGAVAVVSLCNDASTNLTANGPLTLNSRILG
jgi:hypothetical protein